MVEAEWQTDFEWTCEGSPKFYKVGVDGYLTVKKGAYVSMY